MSKDWWDDLPHHPANQPDAKIKFTSEHLHEVENVEIEGIDFKDHPDYCDAFVANATWLGEELTEEELQIVNDDSDFVYTHTLKHLETLGD